MNSQTVKKLAAMIAENSASLDDAADTALYELIVDLGSDKLDAETAADVKRLIETDERAATHWKNFQGAKEFMASDKGQAYAADVDQAVRSRIAALARTSKSEPKESFFTRLSEWCSEWLSSGALPAAAHGKDPAISEPVFGSTHTVPAGGYSLTPDEQGNAWLGVTLDGEPSGALTCTITPRGGEPYSRPLLLAEDKGAWCALVQLNVPFTSVRDATIRFGIEGGE